MRRHGGTKARRHEAVGALAWRGRTGVPVPWRTIVLGVTLGLDLFTPCLRAFVPSCLTAQPSCLAAERSDDEERFVVIRAGKIIPVVGKEITDGVVVIVNGKIRNVGRGLEYPKNARVIDAADRVVMPGLINPRTRFGLPNYDRGGVHGNYAVTDEYFPAPYMYDDLLETGYTTLGLIPAGSGIPGRAMVVRTAGPADQRVLAASSYLRVWPDKAVFRGALDRAQQEIDKFEKAKKDFEEQQKKGGAPPATAPTPPGGPPVPQPVTQPVTQPATAPTTKPAFQPPQIDPAHQALVDLIQKKEGAFALIELRNASDYLHLAEVLRKYPIAHRFAAFNNTQSDLFRVVDKLGEEKASVAVFPLMNRVPYSVERIPVVAMLSKAGCEVSLLPANDSVDEHRRILQRTAELVRDGWPREEALQALTLHPARLLGLENRLGSIEKDRDADLIFLDGDPLAPEARVREVMIAGEIVRRVGEDRKQ